jgi:hypothetical protein
MNDGFEQALSAGANTDQRREQNRPVHQKS